MAATWLDFHETAAGIRPGKREDSCFLGLYQLGEKNAMDPSGSRYVRMGESPETTPRGAATVSMERVPLMAICRGEGFRWRERLALRCAKL